MTQPLGSGSGTGPLRFEAPDTPPQLTPLVARALLKLLLDIHRQPPEVEQQALVWDRTA
ncbi:MAG: hypothetical protein JWO62_2530 [Acidimicrobiaceae bacterium]|nr:hypothetical protein [Acidimicrobiaceae bacterium]